VVTLTPTKSPRLQLCPHYSNEAVITNVSRGTGSPLAWSLRSLLHTTGNPIGTVIRDHYKNVAF